MTPKIPGIAFCLLCAALAPIATAADSAGQPPPKSWIDPDTGHRVIRLTDEPDSDSFYFNVNAFTPDGREMAYTTADGSIGVVDLTTFKTRIVVRGPVKTVVVGRKTPSVYYIKTAEQALYRTNLDTGETRKVADIPDQGSVTSINADETLAGGTRVLAGGAEHKFASTDPRGLMQAVNKTEMMLARLAAHLRMEMYTINLQTGKVTILVSSHDWLNHLQFSPTDPTLLLYCHEGMWWLVDRIWTIRTDATQNQLVHKRTMEMETDGHEWWSPDGKEIFYQLHYPKGMESSFIANYDVTTGERVWLHYTPDMTSIHDNSSPDGKLFCGDGNFGTPWIFLFRPVINRDNHTLGEHLIKGGYLQAEKLVNMAKTDLHGAHNYLLEPNPAFTPDQKYIIFRSDIFGPSYAFAVEVAKAAP